MKFKFLFLLFTVFTSGLIKGQEDETGPKLTPAMDIFSNYIWRGTMLGTGPAMQPSLVFTSGGFAAGVWGAFDFHGYQEADPYIYYVLPFGLSLGLTDYYYPSLSLSDFSLETGSHALEINTGYSLQKFYVSANYILNQAGGAGSDGKDLYFEGGYNSGILKIFLGAGNGWHTTTGNFNVCNVGIGAVKKIRIGEEFILPITGQVIVNPEREKLYVMAGISF